MRCFALLLLAACQSADIAFVNVDVVDVENGRVIEGMTVLVDDGLVSWFGPHAFGRARADVVHEGGTLLPGLIDLHGHDVERPEVLRAYLAAGVTTVRGMGGDPAATIRARDLIEAGEQVGPRLVVPGPYLGGPDWAPWHVPVEGEDAAVRAVREAISGGADFIKVHDVMTPEAYRGVASETARHGVPFAGHVPRGHDVVECVRLGQASLEHASILAEHALTREALASEAAYLAWQQDWTEGPGQELIRAMLEEGAVLVATLVASEAITNAVDPAVDVWADPRAATLGDEEVAEWKEQLPVEFFPEGFLRQRLVVDRAARHIAATLHAAGVPVLVGTDAGAPHVYFGSAIHDELALLREVGLSGAELLHAATAGAARFLGLEDVGRVAPGFVADLVLVDGNPLEDLEVLRAPRVVVRRGRLVPSPGE